MSTQTISVTDLRQDLDGIFKRVKNGQTFELTHRLFGSIIITPKKAEEPKRLTGLAALDAAARKKSPYDPNKTWKEIYSEEGEKKYGKDAPAW